MKDFKGSREMVPAPVHPFVTYRRIGQFMEITKDLVEDVPLPNQNPFDLLRDFDSWFGWAKAVHFDKIDPVVLNIEIFKMRILRQYELEFWQKSANCRGILNV